MTDTATDHTTAAPMADSATPAPPTACLQAGPLEEAQQQALRPLLATWPQGSWTLETVSVGGRWMVYMGRFADEETLAKKRAELRALKIDSDRPLPSWQPGLALGRFPTEEAAERGLSDLVARGVRTARVVRERPDQTRWLLRLPAVDAALRPALDGLRPALADQPLQPCE